MTLTALVVLCKTQSRGLAMTPNMGEAWGAARVFAYLCNVLIITCAFQTRSVPSFAEFHTRRLNAQHEETKIELYFMGSGASLSIGIFYFLRKRIHPRVKFQPIFPSE